MIPPSSRVFVSLASILAAAALLACAAPPPDYQLAPGHAGAPGVERVLMAPMNLSVNLASDLEPGIEPVEKELAAYLEAKGMQVQRLHYGDARRSWDAAVAAARAANDAPDLDDVARIFAKDLRSQVDFDALLLPSIVEKKEPISGRTVQWDGVTRTVRHKNIGRPKGSAMEFGGGSYGGTWPVCSLNVQVYLADGRPVYRGNGGLDVIIDVQMKFSNDDGWEMSNPLRENLLQDPVLVEEGVRIALQPYLDPQATRATPKAKVPKRNKRR